MMNLALSPTLVSVSVQLAHIGANSFAGSSSIPAGQQGGGLGMTAGQTDWRQTTFPRLGRLLRNPLTPV